MLPIAFLFALAPINSAFLSRWQLLVMAAGLLIFGAFATLELRSAVLHSDDEVSAPLDQSSHEEKSL